MKFLPYLGAFALCLHAANASPRINEFLAVNGGPIVDVDGDESDWIEIKNTAATPIDLAGWRAELDKPFDGLIEALAVERTHIVDEPIAPLAAKPRAYGYTCEERH